MSKNPTGLLNAYTLDVMPEYPREHYEWRCDYCGGTEVYVTATLNLNTGKARADGADDCLCGSEGCVDTTTSATVWPKTDPVTREGDDCTPEFP